jgi:hypothetical protein
MAHFRRYGRDAIMLTGADLVLLQICKRRRFPLARSLCQANRRAAIAPRVLCPVAHGRCPCIAALPEAGIFLRDAGAICTTRVNQENDNDKLQETTACGIADAGYGIPHIDGVYILRGRAVRGVRDVPG